MATESTTTIINININIFYIICITILVIGQTYLFYSEVSRSYKIVKSLNYIDNKIYSHINSNIILKDSSLYNYFINQLNYKKGNHPLKLCKFIPKNYFTIKIEEDVKDELNSLDPVISDLFYRRNKIMLKILYFNKPIQYIFNLTKLIIKQKTKNKNKH